MTSALHNTIVHLAKARVRKNYFAEFYEKCGSFKNFLGFFKLFGHFLANNYSFFVTPAKGPMQPELTPKEPLRP